MFVQQHFVPDSTEVPQVAEGTASEIEQNNRASVDGQH